MSEQKTGLRLKSSRINFLLIGFSTLILAVALVYVAVVVNQKEKDERSRILSWAISTRRQADLAQRVGELYADMERQESQYAMVWSFVYEKIFDPAPSSIKDFEGLRKILMRNNRPFLLVDNKGRILESHDPEVNAQTDSVFSGEIEATYSTYPPISVDAQGFVYYIYFKPSNVFNDIQAILSLLERSFSQENLKVMSDIRVRALITDSSRCTVLGSANIDPEDIAGADGLRNMLHRLERLNKSVELQGGYEGTETYRVYYEPTPVVRHLRIITWVLLFTLLLNITGIWVLIRFAHRMEQNRLWWGMSKETAHQLGTPVSSLLAWLDYFKQKEERRFTSEEMEELEKDVKRIELVTNRFSKIGSVPELEYQNIVPVVYRAADYLKDRSSKKITYTVEPARSGAVYATINAPLLEWVIENLCKNSLNAIGDKNGEIRIVMSEKEGVATVDVSDNGKGMNGGMVNKIFEPGYSTKPRGWGVGLTLCKRIVEQYHGGKIFVKETAPDAGATFRVVLKKERGA